jgi:hypothetical protein
VVGGGAVGFAFTVRGLASAVMSVFSQQKCELFPIFWKEFVVFYGVNKYQV